jgi:hypothetical protein
MRSKWHLVAFPVILPWRQEFWTLPLYFPRLQVGVTPDWPPQLPYQGIPLPPEADPVAQELQHYKPGDLRQWQAFKDFQREQGEDADLIRAIRSYGDAATPAAPPSPDAWSLAWQLEKMQADQDARLHLVDQGQDWLREILTPEPWDESVSFGQVPGVGEMVDPEMALLRYRLWRRVMAPALLEPFAPLLLGRTSRPLFLALKGWPEWTNLIAAQIPLPGCRSEGEWRQVAGKTGAPTWQEEFQGRLAALLEAAADQGDFSGEAQVLKDFVARKVAARWPFPDPWQMNLEVWAPDKEEEGPVLCWGEAGTGILPG